MVEEEGGREDDDMGEKFYPNRPPATKKHQVSDGDRPTLRHVDSSSPVKRFLEEQIPFNRLLGIRLVAMHGGRATVELPFRPELVGDPLRPALHGGAISTLIDFAGGAAAWSTCDLDSRVSTIDLRVDYLRPAALATLYAEARVVRSGNRVAVVDVAVFQGESAEDAEARDQPIATGKCVYNLKRPPTTTG